MYFAEFYGPTRLRCPLRLSVIPRNAGVSSRRSRLRVEPAFASAAGKAERDTSKFHLRCSPAPTR